MANTDPTELPRMKTTATSLAFVLALGGAMTAAAQLKPAPTAHAQHPKPTVAAPQMDIPSAAQAPVAVVEH